MSEGNDAFLAGGPEDLDRIADALEGAGQRLRERVEADAVRDQHLGELSTAVTALCISTDALVIAVKGSAQRNRQFRWTMLAVGALALIGIAAVVVLSVRLTSVADSNHKNNQLILKSNQLILSCTTPTGACHRDGQQQTAAAVALLERQMARDAAAAALCARTNADFDHLLDCVTLTAGSGR